MAADAADHDDCDPGSEQHEVAGEIAGEKQTSAPKIGREDADEIRVGAGGKLTVPREDNGDLADDSQELDLAAMQAKKVRKPNRREWIVVNPATELPTKLLLHKPKLDGMDEEHYYVSPNLRQPIGDELKGVRVFQYYSLSTKTHALWIVKVSLSNDWYESLAALLKKPAEFFAKNAIRIISDKERGMYRVKFKPLDNAVPWPAQSTSELLGEALGANRFITTPDHPVYADLVAGSELK